MTKSIKGVLLGLAWLVSTVVLLAVGVAGTFLALSWLGTLTHGTYEVAWPAAMWLIPIALTASAPTATAALYLREQARLSPAPA